MDQDPTRYRYYVQYFPVNIKNKDILPKLSINELLALKDSVNKGDDYWWGELRSAVGDYGDTCRGHVDKLAILAELVEPYYKLARKIAVESACAVLWLTGGENTKCTVGSPLPKDVQTRILSLLYGDAVIKTVLKLAKAVYNKQLQDYKKLMILRTRNAIYSTLEHLSQKEVDKSDDTVGNTTLPPPVLSRIWSFLYEKTTEPTVGHKPYYQCNHN